MKTNFRVLFFLLIANIFGSLYAQTVTTTTATNVTGSSATSGGTISSVNTIIARGVCWGTSSIPVLSGSHTTNGSGTGSFVSSITGLLPNTLYFIRAYATTSTGTVYGIPAVSFMTTDCRPLLNTSGKNNITCSSAICQGNITTNGNNGSINSPVNRRGICWGLLANPDTLGLHTTDSATIGIGSISATISGLQPNTLYHFRAYAKNDCSIRYGADSTFTTLNRSIPSVITNSNVSAITQYSATLGGTLLADGCAPTANQMFLYGTNPNLTLNAPNSAYVYVGASLGTYSKNIISLEPGTLYYFRAASTNSIGTAYGNIFSFSTLNSLPMVNTVGFVSTYSTSVKIQSQVIRAGAPTVTRGICWGTSSNPLYSGNHTVDSSGLGVYISNVLGLTPGTTYYFRAYALNSVGVSYGSEISFTTYAAPSMTNISLNSKKDTLANISASFNFYGYLKGGFCWSMDPNPTISNSNIKFDLYNSGDVTKDIFPLNYYTRYHFRAFIVENDSVIWYGPDSTFITNHSITTTPVSSITPFSAIGGGFASSVAGLRGVSWGVNPTILNFHSIETLGLGSYTANLSGLTMGTKYFYRAYKVDPVRTDSGELMSFTTPYDNSLEVYFNNISFYTNVIPSPTNPSNYLNQGKNIRFKLQCYNNKGNGMNIISGLCKVRTNDPYITLIDSTSALNNVGYKNAVWSADEFEISISPNAPDGYIAYVDFLVIENSQTYYTYHIPVPITPINFQSKLIDDDNNPDSKGNSNSICESTEVIETLPSLKNVSTLSANSVVGTLVSENPGIVVWNSKIGINGIVSSTSNWNVQFGTPRPINPKDSNMIPYYDFVFDYNYTQTYHFKLYLWMAGNFYIFPNYAVAVRWKVPVEFNLGYPEIPILTPTVTTGTTAAITSTTATCSANVVSDGGISLDAKGICIDLTTQPTINNSPYSFDGIGLGTFTHDFTDLLPNTTYYVRAYATNPNGTAYGNEVTFTTLGATGLLTSTNGSFVNVYPNPNEGRFVIETNFKKSEFISITMYNLTGESVYSRSDYLNSGNTRADINTLLSPGIYILKFVAGNQTEYHKVFIN